MLRNLWKGQRFLPLLITQFLGAFNDNLFKNALMTFVAYKMLADVQTVGMYANLAAGIFILPYFLFSAFAGALADKFNRAKLTRILKLMELILMCVAGLAFYVQNLPFLMVVLFLMGAQSAFFGPIKYALLPQLLHHDELIDGNATVEASTYISIIFGAISGTIMPVYLSMSILILCAIGGVIGAFYIPDAPSGNAEDKIDWNFWRQIKNNLSLSRSHIIVFRTIIGSTWFWILGAFFLTELFPLCSKVFNTDKSVVTLFLVLFSVGVGVGAMLCSRLLKGEISIVFVPISAVGLSVCAFGVYILSTGFVTSENPISLSEFLLLPRGLLMSVCLFVFACMGGLYVVPLNALMQKKAPKNQVASVIAGNNIINSLGMAGISLFSAVLIGLGCKITDLFLFVAIISAGVAFYICKLLPDALVRSVFRSILKMFFRVEVNGVQNLQKAGRKTLIVANHVSLLDGILIATFLPRKITFAIDSEWGNKWYVKMFDGLVEFYPLNPRNPLAVRALIDEVNKNKTVMIFPEGRISVTGSLMKVYEGAGVVAEKSGAKIVPLRIDGAQYSKFSYLGNLIKTQMFPKIKMFILPACEMKVPENLGGRDKRQFVSLKLHDIMANMIYETTDKKIHLFNGLLDAERLLGTSYKIVSDVSGKLLSYGQLLLKSYVLGSAFKKQFNMDKKIAVLLPNSLAELVSFFALQYAGKVPVMLNFSLGNMQFTSCLKTVGVKTVISSKKFIEQGKLERLEECMVNAGVKIVYLEDFESKISIITKLKGLKKYILREQVTLSADKPAIILFTSGSEGLPKAIALSHVNLQANVLQVRSVVPFTSKEVFLNALPMFHSFGLTVGTILPIFYGVKTCFYPSPLHYRIIPEVAYNLQATVICGTDTFLYGYGKMASAYDFFPIKFAVSGGEKLREKTQNLWMKKFGVRIFEGYGTTETSPVLAVNTPVYFKENSVGRLMPGICYKLQPVNGVNDGAKLLVKGDNIMLGYMNAEQPEILHYQADWYDTGDIVSIDMEGFVTIRGREKRFAKVAGEMVSLTAVEQILEQIYPDYILGVIATKDDNKGEKLLLVTNGLRIEISDILKYFRENGFSELWVPKKIIYLPNPPMLGSGKFDYLSAQKLIEEKMS